MRVAVSSAVDTSELRSGQTVRLNEALALVEDRQNDLLAASSWPARAAGRLDRIKVQ
jgi:hypothetical protein